MGTSCEYTVNEAQDGRALAPWSRPFNTRAEAQAWIDERADDIAEAELDVVIMEHPYEACYHVMTPRAPEAVLGFGARIEEDHDGYRVISVPAEHSLWQGMRLASGMWLADDTNTNGYNGYTELEPARACAVKRAELAVRLQ